MKKLSGIIGLLFLFFQTLSFSYAQLTEGVQERNFDSRFNEIVGDIYVSQLKENVEKYNNHFSNAPGKIAKLITDERDRSFYERLLVQGQVKELSNATQVGGMIRHYVGGNILEYDAYSFIDYEIRINGEIFKINRNEPLSQTHKRIRLLLTKSKTSWLDLIISKAWGAIDPADMLTIHVSGIVHVNLSLVDPSRNQDYVEELFRRLNQHISQAKESCQSTLTNLTAAKTVSVDSASVELLGQLGISRFDEPTHERLINVFLARSLKNNVRSSAKSPTGYQSCEAFKSEVISQHQLVQNQSALKERSERYGDICPKMKELGGCLKKVYASYEDNQIARDSDAMYLSNPQLRVPGKEIEFANESGLGEGQRKTVTK